jgi:hypothetical protein
VSEKDDPRFPSCGEGKSSGSSSPDGRHDDVTCRKLILEYLLDYESGAMPEAERSELQRHFEDCPPCGIFLTSYRATGKTLRMLKPSDVPADLARAVIRFVRSRSGKE